MILFLTYLAFSLFVIFALIPASGFMEQLSYILLWAGATFIMAVYLLRNGIDFVNYPSLVHIKQKED